MKSSEKKAITVETKVNAPVKKVWQSWTDPTHIKNWSNASPDWHTPFAENDLRVGGKFVSRMEARDGSAGFDFGGVYDEIIPDKKISYTIGDGRKVSILFKELDGITRISETFEAEDTNPIEMQRGGWQAILDNFAQYVESH